jgi:hypothetical protein
MSTAGLCPLLGSSERLDRDQTHGDESDKASIEGNSNHSPKYRNGTAHLSPSDSLRESFENSQKIKRTDHQIATRGLEHSKKFIGSSCVCEERDIHPT